MSVSNDSNSSINFLNRMFVDSNKKPLEFPVELYREILSYLPLKDVCNLSLVAKEAVSDQDKYHRLSLRRLFDNKELALSLRQNKDFTFDKEVRLNFSDVTTDDLFNNTLSGIRPLYWNSLFAASRIQKADGTFAPRFPKVVGCTFHNVNWNGNWVSVFEYFPGLKELELLPMQITRIDLSEIITYCPNLTKLKIQDCPRILEGELSLIGLKNLESLSLDGLQITNLELNSEITTVKEVKLLFCEKLAQFDFLKNAPNLEKLEISWNKNLGNDQLSKIITYCPKLTHLTLRACSKLLDTISFVGLEKLKNLRLINCDNFTDLAFDPKANLKEIYLDSCAKFAHVDSLNNLNGAPKITVEQSTIKPENSNQRLQSMPLKVARSLPSKQHEQD